MRPSPFPNTFFEDNRKALLEQLDSNSLVLLQSAEKMIRNSDVEHSWRQDSNFYYLTGLEQPGCSLLLIPQNDGKPEAMLFIPDVDPEQEKWLGKMLTQQVAKEISGIQSIHSDKTLETVLYRTQKWRDSLYCDVNDVFSDQPLTAQHLFLEKLSRRLPGLQLKKLHKLLTPLRSVKKTEELEILKKSVTIAGDALNRVMKTLKPEMWEYQVEAELTYHYLNNGCRRVGYDIIAAGGKNACVLHYTDNNESLKDGDLLLIDTGGEYGMYTADITRVYPVNGTFTERQRQCYQAVLDVNKQFIEELKPGKSWDELYKRSGEIIGEVYHRYGFIEDPKDHMKVALHRIGHSLGLDVHDVSDPKAPLQAGAVITVEPGLYLPDEGIGIRIEDNILITEDGCENLSSSIPKEIEEIEAIMKG